MERAPNRRLFLAHVAALSVLYIGLARFGLMLGAVSGFATLVWPPTGLAIAAVLLLGYRVSVGVFLGALVVNMWTGAPLAVAIGIATGNTLEAILAAWALRALVGFQGCFDRLRHVIGLIFPAATLCTLVSATVGVASLVLGGIVPPARALVTWRAWWLGDALGALVVAPLLLSWATTRRGPLRPTRVAEALVIGGLLTATSLEVFFSGRFDLTLGPFDWPYILFPLFVWPALRFELRGATAATALVSIFAIWGTARGSGPFATGSLSGSLVSLQSFMGSAALTPLVVAGAVADRARALRVRENLIATVSHDLRNPLNTLQMSAEALATREWSGDSAEAVHHHHRLVRRSVDRMTRLITDLLDAAAIDAGQLSVNRRPQDASAIVREAVDVMQPLASGKQQAIHAVAPESVSVFCDRDRVLQVLSNIIGNAIKFTDPGRAITVTVKRMGSVALLSVEDQGAGIDGGELRHVFDRYWHAETKAGGGTGLGLFISKGIVEAHDGKIWAESKPSTGSTFRFTLPVREPLPESVPDGLNAKEM